MDGSAGNEGGIGAQAGLDVGRHQMSDTPFFTIVVPTFNRGRHIVPTLQSALDQTFSDFELLVVGDGVDDTLDHVPRTDPRVGVIGLPWNSGSQATPNNVGIAAARGRYVAYLGHDDIWMPNHLAALAGVFETSQADVAVSGCAYHGPPGTDLIWISGLSEDLDATQHFFPPTSLAHRASLSLEIGGWRSPASIVDPVDSDFILRAAKAGAQFVSTGEVTAHKFAAGHRYLSYLDQTSSEQAEILGAVRSGAVDRHTCENYVERAKAAGTFMIVRHPDSAKLRPGDLFRQNRSNKGIDRAASMPLMREIDVEQSMEPRALDWYPAEQRSDGSTFRWSGPSLRPKLLIPFTGDVLARITLHLSSFDPAGVLDQIRLTLNGMTAPHATRRKDAARAPRVHGETSVRKALCSGADTASRLLSGHGARQFGPQTPWCDIEGVHHCAGAASADPLTDGDDLDRREGGDNATRIWRRRMKKARKPDLPNVVGGKELIAKQSAVSEQGKLRLAPIHGVVFRPARPVPHEDGHVTEVARASWDIIGGPVVQVHLTTTLPGRSRAWGLHQRSTDRLFVVSGLVKIVVFDGRLEFADLWSGQRVHRQREEPRSAPDPAEPLSWLEEHRCNRGDYHQHADLDVRLRGAGRARSALGLRSRGAHHPLSLLIPAIGRAAHLGNDLLRAQTLEERWKEAQVFW